MVKILRQLENQTHVYPTSFETIDGFNDYITSKVIVLR